MADGSALEIHDQDRTERLLRASRDIEREYDILAACLPAHIGAASWPMDEPRKAPSPNAVMRSVRSARLVELTFQLDPILAARAAFVWLFMGHQTRAALGGPESLLGKSYEPCLELFSTAQLCERLGERPTRHVCLVRLAEYLSRVAYGNADVPSPGHTWPEAFGWFSEHHANREQPLGVDGAFARDPGHAPEWNGTRHSFNLAPRYRPKRPARPVGEGGFCFPPLDGSDAAPDRPWSGQPRNDGATSRSAAERAKAASAALNAEFDAAMANELAGRHPLGDTETATDRAKRVLAEKAANDGHVITRV